MEIILLRHGKPKVELKNKFTDHFVICSDLARSKESAKALGLKNVHLSAALFKEANLPHFDNNCIRLPVTGWLILLRFLCLFGFKKNGESFSQAKERSKLAAEKLAELAQTNEKFIVVGHGLMNRLIGKQLKKKGWLASPIVGKSYWEYRLFTIDS